MIKLTIRSTGMREIYYSSQNQLRNLSHNLEIISLKIFAAESNYGKMAEMQLQ